MLIKPITVAETIPFIRQAADLWGDDDRAEFVEYIAFNPEAGDLIPNTGGVRKVRWSRPGTGKRGGVRVIYFYYHEEAPLFLISIYAKSQRENLSTEGIKIIRKLVMELKRKYERR